MSIAVPHSLQVRAWQVTIAALSFAVGGACAQTSSQHRSREEALKRMSATSATGAVSASAPAYSSEYPQRIRDAIRPNLAPLQPIEGNPAAEVEVRTEPDGVIASVTLSRSSGSHAWDAAVLHAVEKTGRIPSDIFGAVPPVLVIAFRAR